MLANSGLAIACSGVAAVDSGGAAVDSGVAALDNGIAAYDNGVATADSCVVMQDSAIVAADRAYWACYTAIRLPFPLIKGLEAIRYRKNRIQKKPRTKKERGLGLFYSQKRAVEVLEIETNIGSFNNSLRCWGVYGRCIMAFEAFSAPL